MYCELVFNLTDLTLNNIFLIDLSIHLALNIISEYKSDFV